LIRNSYTVEITDLLNQYDIKIN